MTNKDENRRQGEKDGIVSLSDRLMMVASMAGRGSTVFDCGCDHGLIPIWLVQSGISVHVIASDIAEGPLSSAEKNIELNRLHDSIETRLSDGIEKYDPGEADTLIIAGMGGPLMLSIISRDRRKTSAFKHFIFQPQSAVEDFRRDIRLFGMSVIEEKDIFEDGKYYVAMHAVMNEQVTEAAGGSSEMIRIFDRYGQYLLEKSDEVLKEHIEKERCMYENIYRQLSSDKSRKRLAEVKQIIDDCDRAISVFYV